MCIHSNEMRTMQCIYTIQFIYFHFFLFLFFGSILPFFVFIFYFLILCLFFYTIWNMITTIKTTIPQRHPLHNLDAVRDALDADNALIVLRIYAYYDTCTSHAGTHDTFISSLRKATTHVCACTKHAQHTRALHTNIVHAHRTYAPTHNTAHSTLRMHPAHTPQMHTDHEHCRYTLHTYSANICAQYISHAHCTRTY